MAAYELLGPTNMIQDIDFVGDPVRAAGWYGMPEGLHTIAIYSNTFRGRIFIEGSLSENPSCADWFPIKLDTCDYIELPKDPLAAQLTESDTKNVIGYTFRANILWLRAKVWRSYYINNPINSSDYKDLGAISKILVAY